MLLYKHGALSKDQQYSCESMMNEYNYPVLVSEVLDHEWAKSNLKKFPHFGEDCMGNMREICGGTHKYGIVGVPQGRMYFMYDKEDYEKVCSLPIVIDKNPFETILRIPRWFQTILGISQ